LKKKNQNTQNLSTGHVLLYDIRSSIPLVVKDHQYGFPIKKIAFHSNEDHKLVISTDKKAVKFWNRTNGRVVASKQNKTMK